MHYEEEKHMKIISVQSKSGGTGVTLTAAELALEAMQDGLSVVAVDTCGMRHLRRDIEEAGFHYLDDVRQLFRPLSEARWLLGDMPYHALFCYSESNPVYLSLGDDGDRRVATRSRAGQEPNAARRFATARLFLERHYDVMIVDVENKNKRLMQLFHDVSDEVHVMLREHGPGAGTIDDWHSFVERPNEGHDHPKILTHADRKDVPGDLDLLGNSIALKPYLKAAENWPKRVKTSRGMEALA
jgi:hypothetical protein